MKKTAFIYLLIIGVFASCSKDDKSDENLNDNKFRYGERDYPTDISTFLNADDNTYLFFENKDLTKIERTAFVFSKQNFEQLDGIYTYNPYPDDPQYDPISNFSSGSLTLADGVAFPLRDGKITIQRTSGNNITVSYFFTTANGSVEGQYSGESIFR